MRILYCPDRAPDPRFLKALRELHHVVESAADLEHGLVEAGEGQWGAIVLDLAQSANGAVERFRRAAPGALLVVLTSSSADDDRIALFRAGADCVFPRPYEIREISARLDVSARHRPGAAGLEPGAAPHRFDLSPTRSAAVLDGVDIALSRREYSLLALLAGRPGEVLSPAQIIRAVWGEDAEVRPEMVQAYIGRLRAKLEHGRPWRLLHAVRGHGYLFRIDPA